MRGDASATPLLRRLLAGGIGGMLLAIALPVYGWAGLRTIGPTVGVIAGLVLLAGSSTRRPALTGLGVLIALAAVALIGWRLATPAGVPTSLRPYLHDPRSTGALVLALIAGVWITAVGLAAGWRQTRGHQPTGPVAIAPARRRALGHAWQATMGSRILIWVASLIAVIQLGTQGLGTGAALARPFGHLGTLLASPSTAWDAGNYLTIAQYGYGLGHYYDAFFPLYPSLIRLGAFSPKAAVVTGVVISLAALVIALYLLYRLVELECGGEVAGLAVLLVAFFPMGVFFSAIYSESLFLALTLGAIYAARRQHWAWAGILGAMAAATRVTGVLVVVPLAWMYTSEAPTSMRRHLRRPQTAWLVLVPAGAIAFAAYQGIHGDWLASLHAEHAYWHRSFGPLSGAWHGVRAFVLSLRQIVAGPASHILHAPPPELAGQLSDPMKLAAANITDFASLAFACVATVGAWRRLPRAYGLYAAVSLIVLASSSSSTEPLMSFPRFAETVFPLQIWLAHWAQRSPGRRTCVLALSAGLLALFAGLFATWHWVA